MVYLFINFSIIVLDQITKRFVCNNLDVEEKREIVKDKFYLWHKKNTGISFSFLCQYTKQIAAVTCVMTMFGYIVFLFTLPLKGLKALKLGLCVALGGASGNLIDRIRDKKVTDFIYLKYGKSPIFNIADVCILVGTIITAVSMLKTKK